MPQRKLTAEEKEVLNAWLRDIDIKNKTVTGQLMSLHDWEQGLKRARKNFQEGNK
jgi:hypothetical protein